MTVEMKSVNHRYLDVNMKMPKKLNFFDASIRGLLKTYIQRGKVDLFITYEDTAETNFSLKYKKTYKINPVLEINKIEYAEEVIKEEKLSLKELQKRMEEVL